MRKFYFVVLVVLVCSLLSYFVLAPSPTVISTCTTITSPGIYVLNSDISTSSGIGCLSIEANNVVLDCQGYVIPGNNSGIGIGVFGNNSIIDDCYISNFETGISYFGLNGALLKDSFLNNNTGQGVNVEEVSEIVVRNNEFSNFDIDAVGSGDSNALYVEKSYDVRIVGNTINDEGVLSSIGINLFSVENLQIYDNYISGFHYGLYSYFTEDVLIERNILEVDNSYNGDSSAVIETYSENSSYIGNNISSGDEGLWISYGLNGLVYDNNIASCDEVIGLSDSIDYVIDFNYLTQVSELCSEGDGNLRVGLYLDNEGTEITRNTFERLLFGLIVKGSDNLIYDNIFEDNYIDAEDDGNTNYWNTTLDCTTTNIIGGSCVGGNYWDDYSGNDTDSDGIGDTDLPFNDDITNGGDYLPLVYP